MTLEHVIAKLRQSSRTGEHRYATIDLANMPEKAERIRGELKAAGAICLIGDRRAEAERASPWLLNTTGSDIVLNWTARLATQHSAVTWLVSPLDMSALTEALSHRMDARLPDGDDVLLRFFDPRVLPVLHRVLDPQQRAAFFSIASEWSFVGRDRQVQRLDSVIPGPTHTFGPPLSLTMQQFTELLDAAEVDAVMPEVVRQAPEEFLAIPAPKRAAFTQTWLDRATSLGLSAHSDRVGLVLLALRLGPGFDQRAPWNARLARVARREATWAQTLREAVAEGDPA